MKKRRNFLIYPLLLMSMFLVFASSCEKDDDDVPNTFTDSRDSNFYKTVTIGSQVWMAEDLKYLPDVVGPATGSHTTPYYYVYGYNGSVVAAAKATANYTSYGVLYNWEAAKGACPAGWHLPSDAEWNELRDYLGGELEAGGKLKETGTKHWVSPNTGATNETGFTALPGGYGHYNEAFDSIGDHGVWWSATEISNRDARLWAVSSINSYLGRAVDKKEIGLSVRCLKD